MQHFSISPVELIRSPWRHRGLILNLTRREIAARYRGSMIGVLWSFLTPLLMLTVYTFVFGVVLGARWNVESDSQAEFALILFAGLIIYNLFAECVIRAPGLILANANYVKKVVFPLEVLTWVTLGSALFHALVSLLVWLLVSTFVLGAPPATILYLPFVLAPFLLLVAGITWLLASLGVYLRDIAHVVGVIVTAALFLSPIFYPATALPEEYRFLLYLNPLTPAVEQARSLMILGQLPNWSGLGIYTVITTLLAWSGFSWFQKTRRGFADVL